jgi:hypothetical protein
VEINMMKSAILRVMARAAALCGVAAAAHAGTVIELRFGAVESGLVSIENGWARVERASMPARYQLINLETGQVYNVNSRRRMISVLPDDSAGPAAAPDAPPTGATLKPAGEGPTLLGSSTLSYEVRFQDRLCGVAHVSAMPRNTDLGRYEAAMSAYTHATHRLALSQAAGQGMTADVCDLAALSFEPALRQQGHVLRYVRNDQPAMEIVGIRTGAAVDGERLRLPQDFETVMLFQQHPKSAAGSRATLANGDEST